MKNTALLQLEGISRTFSGGGVATEALVDVSLQIRAGEFVCVTGPSGSGKTTLLNILGCLDRPTKGTYRVAGEDATALRSDDLARLRLETFGFVFQNGNLLESAAARDNVELPATYTREPRGQRRRRAADILGAIGLGDRLDHRPADLSGGEQQRVAIGRALMNGARVVLADEPTAALDGAQRDGILALLEQLADRGHAVVVVSHDGTVAARSRRRIELADGRVVKDVGGGSALGGSVAGGAAVRGRIPWLAAALGGWASMRTHPLRAALTVVCVAMGIWSVVALLGLAEGARREAMGVMDRMGANRLSVGGFEIEGNRLLFFPRTLADARAIADEVANVRSVVPSMTRRLVATAGSEHLADLRVKAVDLAEPKTYQNVRWPLAEGTFLTRRDSDDLA